MPNLKPLQEWICDTCHEKLTVEDGWIEWLDPCEAGQGPHSFRIVHWGGDCYKYANHLACADSHIDGFLGPFGLQRFLSMLDVGRVLDPSGEAFPAPPEIRSFTDTIRRLHIPFYEEARLYFNEIVADGEFSDYNEVTVFSPDTCRQIIETYEQIESPTGPGD
jgi:hypothetical protein